MKGNSSKDILSDAVYVDYDKAKLRLYKGRSLLNFG